jgi:hypothetical protein
VFHSPAGRNLLDLQWRIVPHFYSIDFDESGFFDRAEEIDLEIEDGRPRPSECGTTEQPLVLSSSRAAAAECSPRRKPWLESESLSRLSGVKDSGLGHRVRTLCHEDLLLVLCVHAAKHAWVQLSWLCDIARLMSSKLDWNWIQDEARRLGIERIVAVNLYLAHKLLSAPVPPQIQKRLVDDPSTVTLGNEIVRIIECSTHYDTDSIPYFRLMLRLRERWQDRGRFLWRITFTPSVSEWSAVQLPKPLHPLYRLVRLFRLGKRLTSASPAF